MEVQSVIEEIQAKGERLGYDYEKVKFPDVLNDELNIDVALVFETTVRKINNDLTIAYNLPSEADDTDNLPLNLIFVVKPFNRKKLHSHLWLFYGFCIHFNPKYIILLDIGTVPYPTALSLMNQHMDSHRDSGGVCGEILVKSVAWHSILLGAQWYEFKTGHIMNKTFESMCGFVPVLPGAFSAYRWKAIRDCEFKVLKLYLLPFIEPEKLNWPLTNIYFLSEDRIMSMSIVLLNTTIKSKKNGYKLRFIKDAKAVSEGQETLPSLMLQRRRWINGAWFAMIETFLGLRFCKVMDSSHSFPRKFFIMLMGIYANVVMLLSWNSPAILYLLFSMVIYVSGM